LTPLSIVQTIVNIIEPDQGIVLAPLQPRRPVRAVQPLYRGRGRRYLVLLRPRENRNYDQARADQPGGAGLEGTIRAGNDAITYYNDPHDLIGQCDFVMANPAFNVDEVDVDNVKGDLHLSLSLPGVNNQESFRRQLS